MRGHSFGVILICGLLAGCSAVTGPDRQTYAVGAARIDITPGYPVRLCGYRDRRTEMDGVEQRLWARALAIGSDKEGPAIMVTVENCGVPAAVTEEVAARLKKKAGVQRERFVLCSTHTHTGPCLAGILPNIFAMDIPPEQQARIARYTNELTDLLEKAALDALADRRPARLSWSQGEVKFAGNRRTKGGPTDHAMPMLRITDTGGKLRGVVVNYACHCTTLGPEFNKTCGDWAGYASEYIEAAHEGAVALITIGCGADSNPQPRTGLNFAQQHGKEIVAEVDRLLGGELRPITGELTGRVKHFDIPFDKLPTREQWEERARQQNEIGYHARGVLARLARGEPVPTKLDYIVQTWTFGDDLAMVFLAGEVVVDYSLRLKKEFDADRLWVSAYSNDVPCYIPSRRVLTEGGYEAEGAMVYYDRPTRLTPAVENLIVRAVHELLPESFRTEQAKSEFPPSKTPEEALASFRTRDDLTVELVASEPLIVDPVAIEWGLDGRLWVVEMHDYPTGLNENWEPGGRIKVLSDDDGDGRYDRATVFIEDLPFPTGVLPWRKGVLICAAPDILYAEDTDGDGRADVRKKLFTGFATENYQARVNSLQLGLDNWIYGSSGLLGGSIKGTINGQVVETSGRDFRMNPDTGAFEPAAGLTQYGRVRDDWGNWFGNDNSTLIWHFPLPDHYVRRNPHASPPGPRVYLPQGPDTDLLFPASKTLERFNDPARANRVTSACSPAIYRDELLGDEFIGNAFICEPVHNLVHRLILEPKGVTFTAHRSPDNMKSEFLASTDNWFRPSQVRCGPDGALWVVDIYRFVIEHPRWITPERLATLDVRAGADKGRIYRIYPKGRKPRAIPDVSRLTNRELAAALDHPSGTFRDGVHRELVNRGDQDAAEVLRQLAAKSERPACRAQALCVLDGLKALTATDVQKGLSDAQPGVRRQAVRLSEPRFGSEPKKLGPAVLKLATDSDIGVRYQVALSLGEWDDPRAAQALGQLAVGSLPSTASTTLAGLDDPWMRAAVMTSATRHASDILMALLSDAKESPQRNEMAGQLIAVAGASGDIVVLRKVVLAIAPADKATIAGWQISALADTLDALERKNLTLASLSTSDETLGGAISRLRPVFDRARTIALDEGAGQGARIAAIRLLGRGLDRQNDDLELLAGFLQPQTVFAMQSAAVATLARHRTPAVAELLLRNWRNASPSLRTRMLDTLMSREEWIGPLLAAVEKEGVLPAEIDAAHRELLFKHGSESIRKRSAELLAAVRPSSRAEAIEDFKSVLALKGNASNGAALFQKTCTTCHAFRGQGHAVGPNLAALTDRGTPAMLTAILDPNKAVEGKFTNYIVETSDGRTLTGIITDETAAGITLTQGNEVRDTILRTEITELRSSNVSMMPEGLEQGMTPQEVADLIAYVQSGPTELGSSTPEQVHAARDAFLASGHNGLMKVLSSFDVFQQPSWLGTLPMHYCRQTDGTASVAWQTAPVPADLKPDSLHAFRLAAAMGWASAPRGKFMLRMNGRAILDFDVALNDAAWQSADGKVRMNYLVMQNNSEDSTGVLAIEVHAGRLQPGKPASFEVVGSAADSQRWFGVLACPEGEMH